jgi:NodT family efflux transporter outer membrane factor (OMF) lipoprotein
MKIVRVLASSSFAALCCIFAGCKMVGPNYVAPKMPAPPALAWGSTPQNVASTTYGGNVDPAWWNTFNDAELSSLVTRLMRQNLDLQGAAERVQQARAAHKLARSQGLPSVNASANYSLQRYSPNGFLSLVTPAPGAPLQVNNFGDGLDASWELDFFGRVRRVVEASDANTEAVEEARRGLALATVADLANDYVELRGLQAKEVIVRNNLDLADRNLSLAQDRFTNGVATNLDLANAKAQRAMISSQFPKIDAGKSQLINAISLLLAEQPRALENELNSAAMQLTPPLSIPIGIPSDLIRRRPDVLQAEAALHVATAQTGVAMADFYPRVSLSGNVGLQGLSIENAFGLPSRSYNVGPTISVPLFKGGQLRGTLELRQSQQREAVTFFQKTVLNAWKEVDDNLTSFAQAQRERDEVKEAVEQNQIALKMARQQYASGASDFLNVIAAQQALLVTQSALVDLDSAVDNHLIGLYGALGGGWDSLASIQQKP